MPFISAQFSERFYRENEAVGDTNRKSQSITNFFFFTSVTNTFLLNFFNAYNISRVLLSSQTVYYCVTERFVITENSVVEEINIKGATW